MKANPPTLTQRQQDIIDFIERTVNDRGYPPSVREIGEAVGLTSPSTVHSHLATLQRLGFLKRDPTKPRAIEVRYDPNSGAAVERRPDEWQGHFNFACFEILYGDREAGIAELQRAYELDPEAVSEAAKTDSDFDAVRDDPRVSAITG